MPRPTVVGSLASSSNWIGAGTSALCMPNLWQASSGSPERMLVSRREEVNMNCSDSRIPLRVVTAGSLGDWIVAWDELVAQAKVPSPFLRSWWLGAVASGKSIFLLVLEGDSLIGGLAIEQRRRPFGVPVYQFIGSGKMSPDHLDALAAPGKELVVGRAIAAWFTQSGSRVFDLDGVVEHSLLEAIFGSARMSIIDVAPWDELPADAAEYFAALSTDLRSVIRRAQRRLAAAGITHRVITSRDSNAAELTRMALREFVRLQQQRGDRKALLREMPRLGPAVVAGVAAGDVYIHTLASVDRVVLVTISFRINGAVRSYQTARLLDHEFRSAPAVALLEEVRQACADGAHELDMLRGAEPYKARFVHRQRNVLRLRVAHGRLGTVVLAALSSLARARGAVGRLRRGVRQLSGERVPVLRKRRHRFA